MAFVSSGVALGRSGLRGASTCGSARSGFAAAAPLPAAKKAMLRKSATQTVAMAEENMAWVRVGPMSDFQSGTVVGIVVERLDLLFCCTEDGELFCTGNKGTPTSIPLSAGKLATENGVPCIECTQYGTRYSLVDGTVQGKWIPKPFLVSNLLRLIFPEPIGVPTYPLRENNGSLEVLINVNAFAEFEDNYWFGILDSKGKATGEYY